MLKCDDAIIIKRVFPNLAIIARTILKHFLGRAIMGWISSKIKNIMASVVMKLQGHYRKHIVGADNGGTIFLLSLAFALIAWLIMIRGGDTALNSPHVSILLMLSGALGGLAPSLDIRRANLSRPIAATLCDMIVGALSGLAAFGVFILLNKGFFFSEGAEKDTQSILKVHEIVVVALGIVAGVAGFSLLKKLTFKLCGMLGLSDKYVETSNKYMVMSLSMDYLAKGSFYDALDVIEFQEGAQPQKKHQYQGIVFRTRALRGAEFYPHLPMNDNQSVESLCRLSELYLNSALEKAHGGAKPYAISSVYMDLASTKYILYEVTAFKYREDPELPKIEKEIRKFLTLARKQYPDTMFSLLDLEGHGFRLLYRYVWFHKLVAGIFNRYAVHYAGYKEKKSDLEYLMEALRKNPALFVHSSLIEKESEEIEEKPRENEPSVLRETLAEWAKCDKMLQEIREILSGRFGTDNQAD